MTPRRDAGMMVGQRFAVGEPGGFRYETLDELQHPVGAVDEALENLVRIDAAPIHAALVKESLGSRGFLGRRQEHEREEVSALEMRAFLFELRRPFGVHQRRNRIGKRARRIVLGRMAARFDEDRPARAEPAQRVVEATRDADEFGRRGAVEVWSPETRRALEAAIFVEDDAFGDERRPRQEVGEARRLVAVFGEIEHQVTSRTEMGGIADVPAHHFDEERIPLRCPDRRHVADRPQHKAGYPQAKAKAESGRHRAVEDRDRTRRTGEQDRFGERPVDRRFEARDRFLADELCHQISAPPPNEKKDRKKDEAANAIDRPNTIWISRRKPPPASPKASERPVTMMMITATTLVTGPSIDWRICWSGCSHGMLEPAASAGAVVA